MKIHCCMTSFAIFNYSRKCCIHTTLTKQRKEKRRRRSKRSKRRKKRDLQVMSAITFTHQIELTTLISIKLLKPIHKKLNQSLPIHIIISDKVFGFRTYTVSNKHRLFHEYDRGGRRPTWCRYNIYILYIYIITHMQRKRENVRCTYISIYMYITKHYKLYSIIRTKNHVRFLLYVRIGDKFNKIEKPILKGVQHLAIFCRTKWTKLSEHAKQSRTTRTAWV
jgi:hypothetical protein